MTGSITHDKIKNTITKITELQVVKRHYDATLEEMKSTFAKKDEIGKQMMKELDDINELEKLGIQSIFYKVLGNKEEQLEKERQEYLQVTLQYKEILNAIEVIEFEKNILEKKLLSLDKLQNELQALKEKRASEILATPGNLCNELSLIFKKLDDLNKHEVETKEALISGKQALDSLAIVHNHFKNAKEWGNWDMINNKGGGYHKTMKHGSIDRAMNEVSRSNLFLGNFNKELMDIGYSDVDLTLQLDNISRFPGVIFDNLISDWIVQSKIKGVLSTVKHLIEDVESIMLSITKDKEKNQVEYEKLSQQKHALLEEN